MLDHRAAHDLGQVWTLRQHVIDEVRRASHALHNGAQSSEKSSGAAAARTLAALAQPCATAAHAHPSAAHGCTSDATGRMPLAANVHGSTSDATGRTPEAADVHECTGGAAGRMPEATARGDRRECRATGTSMCCTKCLRRLFTLSRWAGEGWGEGGTTEHTPHRLRRRYPRLTA